MRKFDHEDIYFAACQHATFMEDIDKMRKSKAETVKHAHWSMVDYGYEIDATSFHRFDMLRCSRCGNEHKVMDGYRPNYCENCGARMDEEIEGKRK